MKILKMCKSNIDVIAVCDFCNFLKNDSRFVNGEPLIGMLYYCKSSSWCFQSILTILVYLPYNPFTPEIIPKSFEKEFSQSFITCRVYCRRATEFSKKSKCKSCVLR